MKQLSLVVSIIQKYRNRGLSFMDTVEGNQGLIAPWRSSVLQSFKFSAPTPPEVDTTSVNPGVARARATPSIPVEGAQQAQPT